MKLHLQKAMKMPWRNSEQKVQLCDPARILRQGYSLTTVEGRIVTDASQVKPGDVLKTRLAHGELTSRCCENESPQKE